jgi:hypothetical protein
MVAHSARRAAACAVRPPKLTRDVHTPLPPPPHRAATCADADGQGSDGSEERKCSKCTRDASVCLHTEADDVVATSCMSSSNGAGDSNDEGDDDRRPCKSSHSLDKVADTTLLLALQLLGQWLARLLDLANALAQGALEVQAAIGNALHDDVDELGVNVDAADAEAEEAEEEAVPVPLAVGHADAQTELAAEGRFEVVTAVTKTVFKAILAPLARALRALSPAARRSSRAPALCAR